MANITVYSGSGFLNNASTRVVQKVRVFKITTPFSRKYSNILI